MPKRSLILAGGGVKVAYQAGVLQVWLDEAGLTFDHADGASGGVFNLAMYCQGMTGKEIADNWRSFPVLRSIGLNWRNWRASTGPSPSSPTTSSASGCCASAGSSTGRRSMAPSARHLQRLQLQREPAVHVIGNGDERGPAGRRVTLPCGSRPCTIDGDSYIDSVYLTDANLMEAIDAAPTSCGSSGRSAARAWKGGPSTTTSRSSRPRNGHCAAISTGSSAATARDAEGKAAEFPQADAVNMLPAEVPLHYLVNFARREFTAAVEQGVAERGPGAGRRASRWPPRASRT